MSKATVPAHTDPMRDCPLMEPAARAQFHASVKAANEFSLACLVFMKKKEPQQQAAWLKTTVGATRNVFQPWNLELLYVLASLGRGRFTELMSLMGLSSRTLSDKLKLLREAGLLDREIFDEQPVRIEYFLTKSGRKVAALASTLLAHLGYEALAGGAVPLSSAPRKRTSPTPAIVKA